MGEACCTHPGTLPELWTCKVGLGQPLDGKPASQLWDLLRLHCHASHSQELFFGLYCTSKNQHGFAVICGWACRTTSQQFSVQLVTLALLQQSGHGCFSDRWIQNSPEKLCTSLENWHFGALQRRQRSQHVIIKIKTMVLGLQIVV